MSSAAQAEPASTARELGQRAMFLGAASAFDFAVQFLLPIVLVRCLDPTAFGAYRLLWLAVGTAMAAVTLAMPGSLYYFLPRSDAPTKRLYINQTLLAHLIAGLIAGWTVSEWNPWLPHKLHNIAEPHIIVPAFVALWVIASILDLLPTVEERIRWQAGAIVGLATVRAIALSLAAAVWRELTPVLFTLLAFVVLRVGVLLWYVAQYHGLRGPILRRAALAGQLKLAGPFWVSGTLYSLRAQADQWVAAALFPLGMFASFSIAGVLSPLVNLFRQSVNYAFLPSMSRYEAAGDIRKMIDLNARANVMVGALILPLFALAFVFAEDVITVVYTREYVEAAPVMRVFIIGLAALVIELGSVTLLLRQGTFMMWVNVTTLVVSVAVNWFCAHHFGLPGAAVGSVIAFYVDRIATLRRISRCTGMPLRQLQNWRALAMLLLAASLAAALTWAIVGHYFASHTPMLQMLGGGAVLVAAYVVLAMLFGRGRGWLTIAGAA